MFCEALIQRQELVSSAREFSPFVLSLLKGVTLVLISYKI